jgi:hypothetical protein
VRLAEGTQNRSDCSRSARQLGQRNPKIKLGTLHQLPSAIYKGGEFRVGRDESLS